MKPRGAKNFFDDLNDMVPQINVGAADSEELTYEYAECLTKELVSAGVRWVWSPVEDITPTVTRVFSADPDDAIRHGLAFTNGMQDNGIAACFKHFPGGGRTSGEKTPDQELYELLPAHHPEASALLQRF